MSRKIQGLLPYVLIFLVVISSVVYATSFSSAAATEHTTSPESVRDSLMWQTDTGTAPGTMEKAWEKDGYTSLFSTPGTLIATTSNSVSRLDSEDGETIWEYKRKGTTLCDAIESGGNVLALFDAGRGCSDIILLDAATGQYKAQAQYGTSSHVARLVYGQKSVAIVTPNYVRVLRAYDLVPQAAFGDPEAKRNESDQSVKNCEVSDVVLGSKVFAVAAKCEEDTYDNNNDNYQIYIMNIDPEESSAGEMNTDSIDTGTKEPVTLPAISISMLVFVTGGNNPMSYVWQLDKDHAEVAAFRVETNNIGYTYQDLDQFGYTWRIGDWVRYRPGSEDLSKGFDITGATGQAMQAGNQLLIPGYKSLYVANLKQKDVLEIDFGDDYPVSPTGDYGFSGRTFASLVDGKIKAYS